MDYQKQAQEYYSKAPTIIVGSGASAAYGMSGMWALGQHLIANTDLSGISDKELDSWKVFCNLLDSGIDLETALHQVAISELLTARVVNSTWNLIYAEDIKVYWEALHSRSMFPLGRLLNHIFKSSLKTVNIVTTNYDRLIEYACEQERIHHYSGLTYGFFRQLSNPTELTFPRRVNIWKVHGSLDWFQSPLKDIVGLSNIDKIPNGYEPQIVTPGSQKYQRTHLEPFRTIINCADHALNSANSYLCVGYGFNDEHIQPKLMARCLRQDAPITIITRSLSDAAKKLLFTDKAPNYLAIERGANDDESIVHSSLDASPITVDKNIWSLSGYLSLIL